MKLRGLGFFREKRLKLSPAPALELQPFVSLRSAFSAKVSPVAADIADSMGPLSYCKQVVEKLFAAIGFRQSQGPYFVTRMRLFPAPEPK